MTAVMAWSFSRLDTFEKCPKKYKLKYIDNKDPVEEYPAKAALIYNFAKFVTWPESSFEQSEQSFSIGWFGETALGDAFKTISNKKIHGRRIKVHHFRDVSDFKPCQILYANSDFLDRFSKENPGLLEKLNVLTVGEGSDFLDIKGVLLITIIDNHLAFEVNLKSAQRANIEISANLLNLAADIQTGSQPCLLFSNKKLTTL